MIDARTVNLSKVLPCEGEALPTPIYRRNVFDTATHASIVYFFFARGWKPRSRLYRRLSCGLEKAERPELVLYQDRVA